MNNLHGRFSDLEYGTKKRLKEKYDGEGAIDAMEEVPEHL